MTSESSPQPTVPPAQTALEKFNEHADILANETPLERLRFFCSQAMNGQDWLDAEQFFDAIYAAHPGAQEAKDAARLDWLESQCEAYGFENEHHGNRWMVDGPFRTVRAAIDAAMLSEGKREGSK